MSALFNRPEQLIRRVYAYVAYRIGDGPEAEDVTSATFERAYRYQSSYDASRGDPLPWLLGIAARCITDAIRARPNTVPAEEAHAVSESHADDSIDRIALREAVAALPERDRDLIALRYGADLTAAQIGDLLGTRTNTVEVALHRALAKLRMTFGTPAEAASEQALSKPTPKSV